MLGNFSQCLVAVATRRVTDEFKVLHWLCQHCDETVMEKLMVPVGISQILKHLLLKPWTEH